MRGSQRGVLALILLAALWAVSSHFAKQPPAPSSGEIRLSDGAEQHILYGDKRGGGHLYGTGKPCKSEFPAEWNGDKIVTEIKRIAANDNLDWQKEKNGYYVASKMIEGVKVRVVMDREKDDIVTAYPLNTGRNPCVRTPANDNYNP